PGLRAATPASATPGANGLLVTLNGAGFTTATTAQWNGESRLTTFVSDSQLTMQLIATDLANSGIQQVTATNSAPGGGISNALVFPVVARPSVNTNGMVNAASYSATAL